MKINFQKLLLELLVIIFVFYCLPFLFNAVNGINNAILFIAAPLTCLFLSLFHALYNGFNIWMPIFIAILFIPAYLLIYFHTPSAYLSNYFYIILFFVLSFIGEVVGNFLK